MPSLTLLVAAARARLLAVADYEVDLDLTRGAEVFGSTTVVRFSSAQVGASTFVELRARALHRARLNGVDLDPAALADGRLALTGLQDDNELVVVADVAYSRTGQGVHRFVDPADGRVYVGAYLGTDLAQQVFACFDQPDLKARFTVTATAPAGWVVVGNGVATQDAPGRWAFTPTPPISTYLFVLLAGPWHTLRAEHRGLPFALHCRASLAADLDRDADELFAVTFGCFDRYLELFDEPYAFDSYEQAFVPGLNWGALETPGCVTFRDEMLFRSAVTDTQRQSRAVVVAHEMAHLWFGDLVTMRWWDDLWLSESFADYWGTQVVTEATRFTGAWTDTAAERGVWGYDADQRSSTHPVAPSRALVLDADAALSNADGITYAKGAAVLRQLVAWLGREAFLRGVNAFLTRHRFANATLADLVEALAQASGRDVAAWSRSWLETTGVDTVTAVRPASGGLVLERAGSRPHRLLVGLYDAGGPSGPAALTRSAVLDVEIDADRTVVDLPAGADPALVLVNEGDLGYVKVRPDARSWATVVSSLAAVPDPLARAVLWTSARDRVRDGELAPGEHLALVAAHLPAETDPAVVDAVLAFARTTADELVDPARRPEALAVLRGVCRALLAAPGADVRLEALRTLAACAVDEDADALQGWLAGAAPPGGIVLDRDLRWRVLLRLCVLGRADADDVAAELVRDPTAGGHEAAARCRAAVPAAAAKQAAWRSLFGDDTLTTRMAVATAGGLFWPEQRDLVAEQVVAWFAAVADLGVRRGPSLGQAVSQAGFPRHAVEAATVRAAERCLAGDDVPPALRRSMADRLDDLRRALAVRG